MIPLDTNEIFSSFEDNNNGGEIVLASQSTTTSGRAMKLALLERKTQARQNTHITLYANYYNIQLEFL